MMRKAASKDGTLIAYDQTGSGPVVILVGGGSTDRMAGAALAALLSSDLTAINYDRRGRGDSGDRLPYAVQREVEDIQALIDENGGPAYLYGTSSGAALALEAAGSGLSVTKLALWEPPYIIEGSRPPPPPNQAEHYRTLVAAGKRGEAVEFFMSKVVGLPDEFVAQARSAPFWKPTEDLAHTLAYDATILGDYSLPLERIPRVAAPTLVLAGGASWDWLLLSTRTLAEALPHGQYRVLAAQDHNVAPDVIAPVLVEFFKN
jgi:pimeloyl-ACP methyl ester carboxylesterase